jgi:molybdate transport system substrate-binding protein
MKRLWVALVMLMPIGVAQVVRVAAASDLDFAMRELKAVFEAANPGVTVTVQLGSSGNFFNQIQQGLPVDLFFSANRDFPERLEAAGLTEPGTLDLYAIGRMVLWVSNRLIREGLDPRELGVALLHDPRVTQLALANPVHAPYGRGGVTLLEYYGLIVANTPQDWDAVDWEAMLPGIPAFYDIGPLEAGKPSFSFIYGENISQAAQLAMSATEVGLLALSLAIAPTMQQEGAYWLAPLESHLRLEQAYVILRDQDRPEVRAFYDFIGSDAGRGILERYGFILP